MSTLGTVVTVILSLSFLLWLDAYVTHKINESYERERQL